MAVDVSRIPNNNKFDPVREAILQLQSDVQSGVSGVGSINGQDGLITITNGNNITVGTVSTTITIGLTSDISITNATLSGYLRGPASFVIDPAAHGDETGTVVIRGNLQVDGDTTTINSTTLTVDDKNIVIASGAANAAAADGAGITIDGADATMTYNSTSDRFVFDKHVQAEKIIAKSNSSTITLDPTLQTSNYALTIGITDDGIKFQHNSNSRGFVFDRNGTELLNIASNGNSTFFGNVTAPSFIGDLDGSADQVDGLDATDFTLDYVTDNNNTTTNTISIGGADITYQDDNSKIRLQSGAFADANDRYEILATGEVMFLQYWDNDQGDGSSLQKPILGLKYTGGAEEATLFGDLRLKSGNVASPTYDAVVLDLDKVNGHVDITNVRNGTFSGDLTATTNLIVGTTNVYDALPTGLFWDDTDDKFKIGVTANGGNVSGGSLIQPLLLANILNEGYIPYVATGGGGSSIVNSRVSDSWLKLTSDTLELGASDPVSHEIRYARFLWQAGSNDKISTVYGAKDITASIQYLGGSTTAKIEFTGGSGGGRIQFNDQYTFPASDGTSGQVLTTDGSGDLSWVAAGGPTTSDLQVVTTNGAITTDAITVGGLTSTGNIQANGWLQAFGFLYTRDNLRVLNAAGNDWNTWGTRNNGFYDLTVGTINATGSITAASFSGNGSGLTSVDADTLDGYHETAFMRLAVNSSSPTNGNFAVGSASGRNFIQSHNGQPLDLNPIGNNVTVGFNLSVGGTGSFGDYAIIGTAIPAGYYQDTSNGAYRALGTDGTRGYYFQSYNGASTTMYVGLAGTYAGRVGIGTTSPRYQLDLAKPQDAAQVDYIGLGVNNGPSGGGGTALGSGIIWKANYSGYTKRSAGIVQIAESNYFQSGLAFYTNGTANQDTDWVEAMRISKDQKVGIGTTSPRNKLQVEGNIEFGNWTTAGSRYIGYSRQDNGNFGVDGASGLEIESGNFGGAGNYDQKVHIWTHTYNGGSGRRLTVDNYGRVGIGTTTPAYNIDVNGTARIQGYNSLTIHGVELKGYANNNLWMISNNSGESRFIVSTSWDWDRQVEFRYNPATIGTPDGTLSIGQMEKNSATWTHGNTHFYTNGTNRLSIDSDGIVTINPSSVGAKKFRVYYDMDVYNTVNFTDSSWGRQGYIASYSTSGVRLGNADSSIVWDFNGSNGYLLTPTWIKIGGGAGIYSDTNGAHFYPNTYSNYGVWRINGDRGGYSGILLKDIAAMPHVMYDGSGNGGLYNQGNGVWPVYYHVGNDSVGIGGSATQAGYKAYVNGNARSTGAMVANGGFTSAKSTHYMELGSATFSWAGSTAYPTIYSSHPDRWVMMCYPHIPYQQNGVNGYTGNTVGSTINFASDASTTTYWGIGCNANNRGAADNFEVSRGTSRLFWINQYGDLNINAWIYNSSSVDTYYNAYGYGYRPAGASNTYGTITTYNAGQGNWSGYSIHYSNTSFMGSGSGDVGIYNASQGDWAFYYISSTRGVGLMTSTTSSTYEVYVGGDLYATGDIVAYSDRRVKENIINIDSALDKVKALQGVYYNRIDDKDKVREIGFIAQDVHDAVPELASYAEDVDEWGVKYSQVTGLHNEAIKELAQQLDKKDEQIANLQAQIDELKQLILNK